MPRLREARIEVDVDAPRSVAQELGVANGSGEVQEHVAPGDLADEVGVAHAVGLMRTRVDQRGPCDETEAARDLAELDAYLRRSVRLLHQQHVVPERPQAEDPLQDGPRRTAVAGHTRHHPGDDDSQSTHHRMAIARSSAAAQTIRLSKCSSASSRAASACAR